MLRRLPAVAPLVLAAALAAAAVAHAATLTVTTTDDAVANDGRCSLREAVSSANSGLPSGAAAGECGVGFAAPFQRIDVPAGTFRLQRTGAAEDGNVSGDLDVRAAVLELHGAGAAATVVRGNRDERVFDVGGNGGTAFTVSGVTLRDGSDATGGAIRVRSDATLNLSACSIANNDAGSGGGIHAAGGLAIDGCAFHANSATAAAGPGGGAIAYSGSAVAQLSNVTFNANDSLTDASAARFDGPAQLNNVTFAENVADADFNGSGDGALLALANVHISNTLIAGNADLSVVTGGSVSPDCVAGAGLLLSDGYNLIGNTGAGCAFTATPDDQVGSPGAPINPKLLPFAVYVGTLESQPPAADSPAIDRGHPGAAGAAPACAPIDGQGLARPHDARCDVGAAESTDRIFADRFGD